MESEFGATSMHFLARQKTVVWKDFQLKKAKMDGRHALNALTRDTYKAESFRHASLCVSKKGMKTNRFETPKFLSAFEHFPQ